MTVLADHTEPTEVICICFCCLFKHACACFVTMTSSCSFAVRYCHCNKTYVKAGRQAFTRSSLNTEYVRSGQHEGLKRLSSVNLLSPNSKSHNVISKNKTHPLLIKIMHISLCICLAPLAGPLDAVLTLMSHLSFLERIFWNKYGNPCFSMRWEG